MPFHSREPTQFFYILTSDKKQVYEPKIFEHATFSNVEKKFDRPFIHVGLQLGIAEQIPCLFGDTVHFMFIFSLGKCVY